MKSLIQLLAAGMLLATSVVYSGTVSSLNVEIYMEDQYAHGVMKTARFSDDPEENIGCGVRHWLTEEGLESWAFCQASLSPDIYVSCETTNAELVDKIAEINSYSYVVFGWDDEGNCNHFGVSTQSMQIPENVGKNGKE